MKLKEIQELINIVDASNLTTFELEEEGLRVVLKKEKNDRPSTGISQSVDLTIQKEQQLAAKAVETVEAPKASAANSNEPTVNSPIVGTFYASSSPEQEPFVQVGSKVKKGETLCIIEAMKLMNEIEAEEDLQIIKILVQNGEMVEYGQPLFAFAKG